MKTFGVSALMLAALGPAPANATIRALFVGINHYQYSASAANTTDADFKDLKGAVGDVVRIKEALRRLYELDLDDTAPGVCDPGNAVSITLTDGCATRDAIIKAFEGRVAMSKPGDTVIFYFAGHGGQFIDTDESGQATGSNDTSLPYDARKPSAVTSADILDREFRVMVARANAKGVNIVTIFDSCHSATATRDFAGAPLGEGEGRGVNPIKVRGLRRPSDSAPAIEGPGGGYRVHLAASGDNEKAREVEMGDGATGGVFTTALIQTLDIMRNATFDDIANEVSLKVAPGGQGAQHPVAEGALNQTLGSPSQAVTLLDATPSGATVTLVAGQLSGVTEGSRYALFGSSTDAINAANAPLATGTVSKTDVSTATLALDTAPASALPARLKARLISRAFGSQILSIGIRADDPALRTAIARAIDASVVAKASATTAPYMIKIQADQTALIYNSDGSGAGNLGNPRDPGFAARLRKAVEKIAHVQAILAIRTDPTAAVASFCILPGDDKGFAPCPPPTDIKGPVLAVGQPATIRVANISDDPRFLYVIGIDQDLDVKVLIPFDGGVDDALDGHSKPYRVVFVPGTPGRYKFVTIATDKKINAQALEQDGLGARDPASCRSALEQLLCSAATGSRDPATPRVGNWSATVANAIVK